MINMPSLHDDGRDGTLFGQRVSAEFVMVLIGLLGGRAEVNMFREIERMRSAGVRIIAQPKFSMAAPDVYRLVDRNGQPWPPGSDDPFSRADRAEAEADRLRAIIADELSRLGQELEQPFNPFGRDDVRVQVITAEDEELLGVVEARAESEDEE